MIRYNEINRSQIFNIKIAVQKYRKRLCIIDAYGAERERERGSGNGVEKGQIS